MGLPRHRVANRTGLQQTKLADTGLVAAQLVHQLALGNQKLRCRQRGIVRLLDRHAIGLSNMDARTVNIDMRLARTRQQRTGTARQRAGRQIGPHMEAKNAVDPIALEHAALAYRLGTTGRFLGRLEHKEHVAPHGARLLANRTVDIRRGGKCHGHVTVMSASVHLAGMGRGKGRPCRLLNGQRIHIGANRRGMRGINAGVEESADAAGARMGHFAGERCQHALDIGNGLRKIEIELRNAVEIAPIATEFLELGHRGSLREAHLLQLIVIQDCGAHVSSISLHFLNVIYEYSCLVKCNVIGSLPLDRGAGTKSRGRAGRL